MTLPFQQIVGQFCLGVFVLSLATLAGAVVSFLFWRRQPPRRSARVVAAFILCFPLLLLMLATRPIVQGWRWTTAVRPGEVTRIEIRRLDEEKAPPLGALIVITDQAEIDRGIEALADAKSQARNHETFADGYEVRFITRASPEGQILLRAFRQSDGRDGGGGPRVLPVFGATDCGEYKCMEFMRWLNDAAKGRDNQTQPEVTPPAEPF